MAQVDKITSELTGDKAEYFLNDGIVIFVKKDNCLYKVIFHQTIVFNFIQYLN